MIRPELASSFLKLGRAEEHFNTLKAELKTWIQGHPYIVSKHCDAEGRRHSLIIEVSNPAPLDRWSLIAGDCVHNLHAALDTLLYALAIEDSGSNPPPGANVLQFPITDAPARFTAQQYRIAVLGNATQARIERAQPYNRPHGQLPPLLAVLSELDNVDKHRLLNVAFEHLSGYKFSFSPALATPPKVYFLRSPIKSGTELAFFTFDPPQRNVEYDYEISLDITVGHSPGPSGLAVSGLARLLELLIEEVKLVIDGIVL